MKGAKKFWLILTCLLASRFLFVYGSAADPKEFRKMTSDVRKKCIAETHVAIEDVENTEYGHFPRDYRLQCYFKCVLETFHMMDKDGTIKYNALKKAIPDAYKETAAEMIDNCTHITRNDHCEKAFEFMRCMFQVNPIAFITP